MRHLVKLFEALSAPNRLRVLKILEVRSLCVCEITEILRRSTSTVSPPSILRDVDLILNDKEGKWINYLLSESATDPSCLPILDRIKEEGKDDIFQNDAEKVRSVDRYTICGA